ncbi:pilus assembly protein, partial [Micrococcus luteus]|nr:pilus assembly protein [Micrococcus luteus]
AGVAAREATLARNPGQAESNARQSARMTLDQTDFTCGSQNITLDTSALRNAPGIPGSVSATITCSVPLSDLAIPGTPGSWTITADATSPVDTYRERG